MTSITTLINHLDARELWELQRELDTGRIERLIAQRLAAQARHNPTVCPVCGAHTCPNEGLRLEFGPVDLRQRATFDGPDCLTFFTHHRLRRTT